MEGTVLRIYSVLLIAVLQAADYYCVNVDVKQNIIEYAFYIEHKGGWSDVRYLKLAIEPYADWYIVY